MRLLAMLSLDLLATTVLVFGLYFRRHRRRDLVASYLGVNTGILAVSTALSTSGNSGGMGLGLGLFGVLSIIRLRSTELDQIEVAYYFASLALGLLGTVGSGPIWHNAALMGLVVLAMLIGDHPRLLRGYHRQLILLDSAPTDRAALIAHLEQLLGARVHSAIVQRLDLVNDTALIDVRYHIPVIRHTTPIPVTRLEAHR